MWHLLYWPHYPKIGEQNKATCALAILSNGLTHSTDLCNQNPPSITQHLLDSTLCADAYTYLPTPPLEQDMTQGQFLSRV